jgi:hypothetical protein
MDPTLRNRLAQRENGRCKAAVVTAVVVFVGAAAVGGVSVALASASSTPSTTGGYSEVQPDDQLQPPADQPRSGSGRRSHGSSGAS